MIIQVIQLDDTGFTLARFRHAGRELTPVTGIRKPADTPAELIRQLHETFSGFPDEETRTLLSLPPSDISLRELQLPITDRAKLRAILPLELAGETARDETEIVCDALPLAGGNLLAGWTQRDTVAELIRIMIEAGAEPEIVTTDFIHWNLLVPAGSDETIAICSANAVTVSRQGKLLFCRTFVNAIDDLERTLAALELTRDIQVNRILVIDQELFNSLKSRRPVALLHLPEPLKTPASQDGLTPMALAAPYAVALAVCYGEPFNLRSGSLAWTRKNSLLLRRFRLSLLLVGIVALLLLAEAGVRWYLLTRDIASLNTSITKLYRETFPSRKKAVDEAAELKAEIRRLEGASVAPAVLPFLRLLAEQKTDDISGFSEIEYDGSRFRIRGDGKSSAAITALRQKLLAAGWQVEQPEITSRPEGTVLFQLKGSRGGITP